MHELTIDCGDSSGRSRVPQSVKLSFPSLIPAIFKAISDDLVITYCGDDLD